MAKPRILFDHDGRHPLIYMYEPPMQIEELEAAVDELVGTPIEALSLTLGDAQSLLYDSQVGKLWGRDIVKWPHLIWKRANQNFIRLIKDGHDPLKVLCDKFSHTRFEPSGFTGNPEIPIAKSITDYIFRWLDLRFGEGASEQAHAMPTLPAATPLQTAAETSKLEGSVFTAQADAPPCHTCGSIMVRSGTCYKCFNCGTTSGCS